MFVLTNFSYENETFLCSREGENEREKSEENFIEMKNGDFTIENTRMAGNTRKFLFTALKLFEFVLVQLLNIFNNRTEKLFRP